MPGFGELGPPWAYIGQQRLIPLLGLWPSERSCCRTRYEWTLVSSPRKEVMSSGLVLVGSVRITVYGSSATVMTHEYAAAPSRGSTDESEQPTTLAEVKSNSLFSAGPFQPLCFPALPAVREGGRHCIQSVETQGHLGLSRGNGGNGLGCRFCSLPQRRCAY